MGCNFYEGFLVYSILYYGTDITQQRFRAKQERAAAKAEQAKGDKRFYYASWAERHEQALENIETYINMADSYGKKIPH